MIKYLLSRVRGEVYLRGHRPKPGSILYSPSLAVIYAWRDQNQKLGDVWGFRKLDREPD